MTAISHGVVSGVGIVGPFLIANLFNWGLLGILAIQTYIFLTTRPSHARPRPAALQTTLDLRMRISSTISDMDCSPTTPTSTQPSHADRFPAATQLPHPRIPYEPTVLTILVCTIFAIQCLHTILSTIHLWLVIITGWDASPKVFVVGHARFLIVATYILGPIVFAFVLPAFAYRIFLLSTPPRPRRLIPHSILKTKSTSHAHILHLPHPRRLLELDLRAYSPPTFLAIAAVGVACCGIGRGVQFLNNLPGLTQPQPLNGLGFIWLLGSVFLDLIVFAALVTSLHRTRAFAAIQPLTLIMRIVGESGFAQLVVAAIALALAFADHSAARYSSTTAPLAPALLLPALYANTLLLSLTHSYTRTALRPMSAASTGAVMEPLGTSTAHATLRAGADREWDYVYAPAHARADKGGRHHGGLLAPRRTRFAALKERASSTFLKRRGAERDAARHEDAEVDTERERELAWQREQVKERERVADAATAKRVNAADTVEQDREDGTSLHYAFARPMWMQLERDVLGSGSRLGSDSAHGKVDPDPDVWEREKEWDKDDRTGRRRPQGPRVVRETKGKGTEVWVDLPVFCAAVPDSDNEFDDTYDEDEDVNGDWGALTREALYERSSIVSASVGQWDTVGSLRPPSRGLVDRPQRHSSLQTPSRVYHAPSRDDMGLSPRSARGGGADDTSIMIISPVHNEPSIFEPSMFKAASVAATRASTGSAWSSYTYPKPMAFPELDEDLREGHYEPVSYPPDSNPGPSAASASHAAAAAGNGPAEYELDLARERVREEERSKQRRWRGHPLKRMVAMGRLRW